MKSSLEVIKIQVSSSSCILSFCVLWLHVIKGQVLQMLSPWVQLQIHEIILFFFTGCGLGLPDLMHKYTVTQVNSFISYHLCICTLRFNFVNLFSA